MRVLIHVFSAFCLLLVGSGVCSANSEAGEGGDAAAVEQLGGKLTRDPKAEGQPIIGIAFNQSSLTDAGLKDLAELESLQSLDLTATATTNAGLKSLNSLKNLQQLPLGETQVTDAGLKELQGSRVCRYCGFRMIGFQTPV